MPTTVSRGTKKGRITKDTCARLALRPRVLYDADTGYVTKMELFIRLPDRKGVLGAGKNYAELEISGKDLDWLKLLLARNAYTTQDE